MTIPDDQPEHPRRAAPFSLNRPDRGDAPLAFPGLELHTGTDRTRLRSGHVGPQVLSPLRVILDLIFEAATPEEDTGKDWESTETLNPSARADLILALTSALGRQISTEGLGLAPGGYLTREADLVLLPEGALFDQEGIRVFRTEEGRLCVAVQPGTSLSLYGALTSEWTGQLDRPLDTPVDYVAELDGTGVNLIFPAQDERAADVALMNEVVRGTLHTVVHGRHTQDLCELEYGADRVNLTPEDWLEQRNAHAPAALNDRQPEPGFLEDERPTPETLALGGLDV